MLAKELKIKTLMKQRKYIEDMISNTQYNVDGDTSIVYVGKIYPENLAYFNAQGYAVDTYSSDDILKSAGGRPINLIYISNEVRLSKEEIERSQEINKEDEFKKNQEIKEDNDSEMSQEIKEDNDSEKSQEDDRKDFFKGKSDEEIKTFFDNVQKWYREEILEEV